MLSGELLTKLTIRIALLLYVFVVARELVGTRRRDDVDRIAWSVACGFFVAHVACAFWFKHDLSHAAALADTARRTREMLGFAFGEGIYFSYLFTLVWIADAVWWNVAPENYRERARLLHYGVHTYMFFIAFNGAIIFEGGVTRWGGIAACILLAVLGGRRLAVGGPQSAQSPSRGGG